MDVYSVSAVTRYLKELIESNPLLEDLWVQGEISNYVLSSAGHVYFTLKDNTSQLRCVLFRNRVTAFRGVRLSNGMSVIVHGRLSVYEVQGAYQCYVDLVQPEGVGALNLQFELLRKRLEEEGLFDAARKRPLPRFPKRIGVATSPTGAVLHDIVSVLRRRYPLVDLLLAPTLVQGEHAAPQICAAIKALDDYGDVDVIVVARGGGSLEELWPFNEEIVARTIFAARVPVVTGIGHETDFTIADLVADMRAPTPSAAAELIVPHWRECKAQVATWQRQLATMIAARCARCRGEVEREEWTLQRLSPQAILDRRRLEIDDMALRARSALQGFVVLWRAKVEGRSLQLRSLDPRAVLDRGYSICRMGNVIVSTVHQVSAGDAVTVQVSDGQFETKVEVSGT